MRTIPLLFKLLRCGPPVLLLASTTLYGCSRSIVTTQQITSDTLGTGTLYCLPRTFLKLSISQGGDQPDEIKLDSATTADPDSCYQLQLVHSLFSTDNVTI